MQKYYPEFSDPKTMNDYLGNSEPINSHAKKTGRRAECIAADYVDGIYELGLTREQSMMRCLK